MTTKTKGPVYSGIAGAAMEADRCVKFVGGEIVYAGSTDEDMGTLLFRTHAQGDDASIELRNSEGTQIMVASEAITAGNPVYAGANGKVAASGTVRRGTAMSSAGADGDAIEVLRIPGTTGSEASGGTTAAAFTVDTDSGKPRASLGSQTGGTGDFKGTFMPPATLTADRVYTAPADSDQTLVGLTATQTLTNKTLTAPAVNSPTVVNGVNVDVDALTVTAAMSGQTITNEGASGAGVKSLPAATVGLNYRFRVMANQELRIDPNGSETIALPSTGAQQAAGKYITADAIGEFVECECVKAGQWEVGSYRGTWSVEP